MKKQTPFPKAAGGRTLARELFRFNFWMNFVEKHFLKRKLSGARKRLQAKEEKLLPFIEDMKAASIHDKGLKGECEELDKAGEKTDAALFSIDTYYKNLKRDIEKKMEDGRNAPARCVSFSEANALHTGLMRDELRLIALASDELDPMKETFEGIAGEILSAGFSAIARATK